MNTSVDAFKNYLENRDKPIMTLVERIEQLSDEYNEIVGIQDIIKLYRQLLKEKQHADVELALATERRNRRAGRGISGVSTQIKYEMAQRESSTYGNWQFTTLQRALSRILYNKYCSDKANPVYRITTLNVDPSNLSSGEQIYMHIEKLQNPQQVMEYLQEISDEVVDLEVPLKEITNYMKQ